MGCTFDNFNAKFPNRMHTDAFAEIYNELLKEDLYWGEDSFLDSHSFIPNMDDYSLEIQEEPLFNCMDNGDQLIPVVKEYVKRFPDDDFTAYYYCTFSNCGDVISTTYRYNPETKVLDMITLHSEREGIYHCPECGAEFWEFPLATIEDYEEGDTYICPKCNSEIDWEVDDWSVNWELKDNEWI